MLKVAIIDDDPITRLVLKKYIDKTNSLEFVKEYESAISALEDPDIKSVDLILLDVEMPNLSGLEFLEKIDIKAQIIITSINSSYAAKAFDFDVTDFLTKPVTYDRFLKSIFRVERKVSQKAVESIPLSHIYIKNNSGYSRVSFDEILYVEAYSDYMNIYTGKERFTALSTMKAIEERLPRNKFVRVHRSYIVHLDKINRFEDNMIRLGEKVIPVSRSCKENLLKKLNLF